MTDEELAAIRERRDAAKPAHWYRSDVAWVHEVGYENTMLHREQKSPQAKANALFFVYAYDDIAALLAEVDRLRAQVAALRHDALEQMSASANYVLELQDKVAAMRPIVEEFLAPWNDPNNWDVDHCQYCNRFRDDQTWDTMHADDCLVTKARALLGKESD